ncbi:lipid II flippase family protein [Bacillus pseudomycoides]|uniref:lipid II flippase family protein n=2 Tax=Bacillus pseudomycoides TaxID=64104 RepID=UPI0027BB1E03|nr:DUF2837 family protein [Bacillus pseudomycoides]
MLMTSIDFLRNVVRLVGAKLALIASAFALYNIMSLIARFSIICSFVKFNTCYSSYFIINNYHIVATILLTLLTDPKLSFFTDKVARKYFELKNFTFMILFSRLLGTLIAQLILVSSAYYIVWFTKFIS